MRCIACNTELASDAIFCPTCGHRVGEMLSTEELLRQTVIPPEEIVPETKPRRNTSWTAVLGAVLSFVFFIFSFTPIGTYVLPILMGAAALCIVGILSPRRKLAITGLVFSGTSMLLWAITFGVYY